ncbi:unnamed protein product [Effrenium voratum]|nr:unnamed protein product [Effrenium voratum]
MSEERDKDWSLRTRTKVGLLLALALRLLGFSFTRVFLLLLIRSLLLQTDRALALLACWGIKRTPKAFDWTIDFLCIRPSFSFRRAYWSEITVINWTWHNPAGFEGDARSYILQIDRLSLRLELASIVGAIGNRGAVKIKSINVEGVRFSTQRNEEAELNLWAALKIPDNDTNVATIVQGAHSVGGLDHPLMVKPLAPNSTHRTRQASRGLSSLSGLSQDLDPQDLARKERPVGDPRRRPRWGVPFRLDIQQTSVLSAELWLFDLLTLDRRWRLLEPQDTKMVVFSHYFSRETLEYGDPRRSGTGDPADGVRGVYLGEFVWVLIAQLLPRVLESSPRNLLKTAAFAVGFGLWDASVMAGAKTFELALDARYCLPHALPCLAAKPARAFSTNMCFVHVHLICGRGLIRHHDQYCNVIARLELKNPGMGKGAVADVAVAPLRMWTKSPWWDQKFCLGPATSTNSVVRVRCFHRKARHAMSTKCDTLLGQVFVPLAKLLVEDRVINDGTVVGWFPLTAVGKECHGHLKLGFRIEGKSHLSRRDGPMSLRSFTGALPASPMARAE